MAKANRSKRAKGDTAIPSLLGAKTLQEVTTDCAGVIALTPDEQMAFWNALNEVPTLTDSQCRLGAIMRGKP